MLFSHISFFLFYKITICLFLFLYFLHFNKIPFLYFSAFSLNSCFLNIYLHLSTFLFFIFSYILSKFLFLYFSIFCLNSCFYISLYFVYSFYFSVKFSISCLSYFLPWLTVYVGLTKWKYKKYIYILYIY